MMQLARAASLVVPLALACLVAPIVLVGCASTPPPPAPTTLRIPVEQARVELRTVGVTTADVTPNVSLDRPLTSRSQAAGKGALIGAASPLFLGKELGWGGVFLGVLFAPITSIAGTIYGAVAARSPEQVEAAARTLQTIGQSAEVQHRLRDLLMAELDRQKFGGVVALRQDERVKPPVDTVVEVGINVITLVAPSDEQLNINPDLTLHVSGSMRILRGGVEVGQESLTRQGQGHTLMEWADDDAKKLRTQIAHESEELAKEFVKTLLSRPIPKTKK